VIGPTGCRLFSFPRCLPKRPCNNVKQLNVSPYSENIVASIRTPRVTRETGNEPIEYSGGNSDIKHKLWIVDMKDLEDQRGRDAVGITAEVNTDLKKKVIIHLLPPAVAVAIKTHRAAELLCEGNDVSLLPGPTHRPDVQALAFRPPHITKERDLALAKFRIKIDFLEVIEQAFDEWRIPKRRLDKVPGGKKLVQKDGAIFWLNNKRPLIRITLPEGLHRLESDFIPVSIEQMRLLFSTKLDDPVLPDPVDRETKRLECELCRTSTRPVRHPVQKRMFFHHLQLSS
jgi:hypothetical protein